MQGLFPVNQIPLWWEIVKVKLPLLIEHIFKNEVVNLPHFLSSPEPALQHHSVWKLDPHDCSRVYFLLSDFLELEPPFVLKLAVLRIVPEELQNALIRQLLLPFLLILGIFFILLQQMFPKSLPVEILTEYFNVPLRQISLHDKLLVFPFLFD